MEIPPNMARTCRGCQADVAAVSVPGKTKTAPRTWTIVDFVATLDGSYFVELDPGGRTPTLRGGRIEKRGQREGMQAAGIGLHTNHYKTCPKADLFKRLRKPLL